MVKTKEIACELGVTPQSVRNYAKKNFARFANYKGRSWEFTDEECSQIAHHFGSDVQKRGLQSESQRTLHDLQSELALCKVEIARLQERCSGFERENALLRDMLQKSDRALERAQIQQRGFWGRIGQRLLGSGRKSESDENE